MKWRVLLFFVILVAGITLLVRFSEFIGQPLLRSMEPSPSGAPAPAVSMAHIVIPSATSLNQQVLVTKIIDGDTLVIEGGQHVRLIGIDADEKGYTCYDPARSRLEELVLNTFVTLEADATDQDQYGRLLRYVLLDGTNINAQLAREGLAISRFYPADVHYKQEITEAEQYAISNHVGCKWQSSGGQ